MSRAAPAPLPVIRPPRTPGAAHFGAARLGMRHVTVADGSAQMLRDAQACRGGRPRLARALSARRGM